jgi:hypothetical protein
MGWRVKSNRLGTVAKRLPRKLDDTVVDVADAMVRDLKANLWVRTGTIRRVTTERNERKLHAEVWVGYYLGHGFYSGFQEFGVASRGIPARPIVGPTAHRMEPQYRLEMEQAIREACDVG